MSTAPPKSDKKPDMAQRIKQEHEDDPLTHEWVVAAEVRVDTKTAKRASFRGSFRAEAGMRVDALETYCRKCKRPLDEVGDKDCAAKVNNEHLIGGDQSVRAKRKHHEPRGKIIKTGAVDRRGLKGYSVQAGR